MTDETKDAAQPNADLRDGPALAMLRETTATIQALQKEQVNAFATLREAADALKALQKVQLDAAQAQVQDAVRLANASEARAKSAEQRLGEDIIGATGKFAALEQQLKAAKALAKEAGDEVAALKSRPHSSGWVAAFVFFLALLWQLGSIIIVVAQLFHGVHHLPESVTIVMLIASTACVVGLVHANNQLRSKAA